MQIVVHIGTDKTGSSSVQEHLSHNRQWFLDKGIYYPPIEPGVSKGHSALLGGKRPFSGLLEHLGYAYHLNCTTFLLSWEGMSFYKEAEIRDLASYFGDNAVIILAYLREQADILQSGQLQQMKSFSNTIALQDLMKPLSSWNEDLHWWLRSESRDYNKLLQIWRSQIPRAKFNIRIYQKSRLYKGSVVSDFLEQLGVEADEKFHWFTGNANPSLNVEGALLVDKWQHQNLDGDRLAQRIDMVYSLVASEEKGAKYFLDSDVVAAVRNNFEVSNAELAKNFLGSNEPPFNLDSSCCRSVSIEGLKQGMERLEKQVSKYETYPVLAPANFVDALSEKSIFFNGWLAASKQGIRSDGILSCIRFRLYRRRFVFTSTGIRIVMGGNSPDNNAITGIEINGQDFGRLDFEEGIFQLTLLFDKLGECDTIDIVLRHEEKGEVYEPPATLELTRFGYEWLYPGMEDDR